MAFRTWARLLGATLGIAALAGASQLGLAYGLGILRLTRVLDAATRDQWTVQLAWVAWLAMTAAVLGGLAGGLLRERWGGAATVPTFAGLAVAAGVGAALVVPLTMQPARTAQISGLQPVSLVGLAAGVGALAGAVAAYAALSHVMARWSLLVVGTIVWVVALISVAPSLAPSDPLPAVRLGVFDAGFLSPDVTQRTALFTMPAVALLVGAALGWTARRRALSTLTIALAGLPGPALLTTAYLIAGPGSGQDRYQVVPYWAAMTATGAGVLGSVLAAVIRRGGDEDPAAEPDPADRAAATESPDDPAPTNRIPDQRAAPAPTPLGDYTRAEPEPFDAFAASPRPTAAEPEPPVSRSPAVEPPHPEPSTARTPASKPPASKPPASEPPASWPPASEPPAAQPYVPAPAIPPMPPEAIQQPTPAERPARAGGLLGRGRNRGLPVEPAAAPAAHQQFGPTAGDTPTRRVPDQAGPGRTPRPAEARPPLVPEPEMISAPPAEPEPVTPPLEVRPAPRRGRRQATEDEYVDWVSGLGAEKGTE